MPTEHFFDAQEFVDNLLTKGTKVVCDDSVEYFKKDELPSYYKEKMYKKGQAFFQKHYFAVSIGALFGLLADMSVPTGLDVLIMTKKSGCAFTAYKRYTSTLFHMLVWYESDFKPGSKLWSSLKTVKSLHNNASHQAIKALNHRISHTDMILAQWGFMGLILCRPEFLGIYEEDEDNWRCFVHLWRVIGYVLGISDKFNICRESVAETRAICNEISLRIMKPQVENGDSRFFQMCQNIIDGLKAVSPHLELESFMHYLMAALANDRATLTPGHPKFERLSFWQKVRINFLVFVTDYMRFPVIRVAMGYMHRTSVWWARHTSFLIHLKYEGFRAAEVTIFAKLSKVISIIATCSYIVYNIIRQIMYRLKL